ncbi:type I-E CRISPR-associated protein Cas6/Cse3/CasE [Xenorhabdus nematophila]|uniref:type I-E CRISPR-associated protein Cas6/Cse3/CasE n=1 Tax=Xenorhabdus nematophila TaxID=628 RepID=UPI0005437FF1|nr:type I-E CRISPR-associated protein Cas6/Cse3/CasE [Xenorhabdus nematophila]CEE90512.1 Crispr-associated protein, Cse3 family [Xenorhabdus nematophila str. Anatoliense]CEF28687.1 Crispr-associated protein, Cse3 family [Xenorhabdus nematophila str. Websteri]AYA42372.1 type I-E CRISPR-associated protein Cas6/Cse3/CasE [Xenorhabdus nematophila]KHD28159.1 CRISPR-associated protein Cse3 [Xenorhabdus nematophila]MBA0021106.1 type I-E CRISPR-associated protein Cas6/Cse3/CasE [Xenorhabdus nematophil
MYLSKVTLRPSVYPIQAPSLKKTKNDVYTAHQLLWQLFTEQEERNFLFREEISLSGRPEFFVLSRTAPIINSPQFQVQTKPFAPQLHNGQKLAFKLRVNPTVCITEKDSGKQRRHDVLMRAKYQQKGSGISADEIESLMTQAAQAWIQDEKRLANWGFRFDFTPDMERYTQHRSFKSSGQKIEFSSVDFQGVLTLSDRDLFLEQYSKGFGRAKSFGCGLMLIRAL